LETLPLLHIDLYFIVIEH